MEQGVLFIVCPDTQRILVMKRRLFVAVWLVVCVTPLFAADRLTDRDVKQLLARIEDGRDKFDNALDDKFKNSILRDASGEVNVKRFLNTFQESIDRVEESLKPDYAASTEVGTLLRQGSALERYFRQQPGGTKGERMESPRVRSQGAGGGVRQWLPDR